MPMIIYIALIYERSKQTLVCHLFAKPTKEYLVKQNLNIFVICFGPNAIRHYCCETEKYVR